MNAEEQQAVTIIDAWLTYREMKGDGEPHTERLSEYIALYLQQAKQAGRNEGLEEAAQEFEDYEYSKWNGFEIANIIRSLKREER